MDCAASVERGPQNAGPTRYSRFGKRFEERPDFAGFFFEVIFFFSNYLRLLGLKDLMVPRPLGLFVRPIGDRLHVAALHHALGGGHLDAAGQHGGLAQDARGDRVPAGFRAPVHPVRLVVGAGHLGGQVPFGVHGLQVPHVVVRLPGALHEQPAAAARSARGRRRRRHLFGGFGEPVHGDARRVHTLGLRFLTAAVSKISIA